MHLLFANSISLPFATGFTVCLCVCCTREGERTHVAFLFHRNKRKHWVFVKIPMVTPVGPIHLLTTNVCYVGS